MPNVVVVSRTLVLTLRHGYLVGTSYQLFFCCVVAGIVFFTSENNFLAQ